MHPIKNHKIERILTLRHLRGYRHFLNSTAGIFSKNPVLTYGLALPIAVVPSTSLNSGLALAVAMLIVYLPTMLVAAYIGDQLTLWQRRLAYPCLAAGLLAPARIAIRSISPTILSSLGIYFSLLCVTTLLVVGVEEAVRLRKNPRAVLRFGLCNWLGFSVVILLVSAIREVLGSGMLWGMAMPFIKVPVPGMLMAYTGFILVGFLAAGGRLFHRLLTAALLQTVGTQPTSVHQPDHKANSLGSSGKRGKPDAR